MMARAMQRSLWVVAALLLVGCVTPIPANRQAMTPPSISIGTHHPYSVSVKTSGGSETDGLGSSNISNAELQAAIESAITDSRVFQRLIRGSDGSDYELTVTLYELNKPLFGGTFTVGMETAWTLTRTSDRRVVFRKGISSTGVATTSDTWIGVHRLRMAVEAAARDAISQGIQALAATKL
ncbi:MAG: hypothetical protein JNL84_06200 [Candidatus Accumulibacter sp.]|nr:hypothetical protein [Accumulibacter sp.]